MKIRLIIFLTALLIIMLFISLFFAQRSLRPIHFPAENEQIATEIQPSLEQMPLPNIPGNRAITVIKTPRKETKALPLAVDNENRIPESPAPQASAQSISSAGGGTSSLPASGITKINKKPTPVEREEMKSKGIVIY